MILRHEEGGRMDARQMAPIGQDETDVGRWE